MWSTPRSVPSTIPFNTATGTWVDVTPKNVSLDPQYGWQFNGNNTNFGVEFLGADTSNPGTIYAFAHNQGLWKSADYGITWVGPINTGTNGAGISQSGGGITVVPNATAGQPATIWGAFIRGSVGMWKSTDGGVNWSSVSMVPPLPSGRPDTYPPVFDPYNSSHILACGHEQPYLLESTNGGSSWTSKTIPAGMQPAGGTAFVYFLDTGNSTTTAQTWLWVGQTNGGANGTWKTTDQGANWTQVDTNEHPHGACQIWQPTVGVGTIFMAGVGSASGNGVLRSTDYGSTWSHVSQTNNESVVFGSSNFVYTMYGWSTQTTENVNSQYAAMPGTGTWSTPMPGTPSTDTGGVHSVATLSNGGHTIYVAGMGCSGIWRYVE